MTEYVDVRGPWPIYVNGPYAVKLVDYDRNITLAAARLAAQRIQALASQGISL